MGHYWYPALPSIRLHHPSIHPHPTPSCSCYVNLGVMHGICLCRSRPLGTEHVFRSSSLFSFVRFISDSSQNFWCWVATELAHPGTQSFSTWCDWPYLTPWCTRKNPLRDKFGARSNFQYISDSYINRYFEIAWEEHTILSFSEYSLTPVIVGADVPIRVL